MFTYRIATDEVVPLEFEKYSDGMIISGNYGRHWGCRYVCGEYWLCSSSYDPMDGLAWRAARVTSIKFEFIEDVKETLCAMECAIKLHEFLLAAGIVGDTGTTVAAAGDDDNAMLCWCGTFNCTNRKHQDDK